MRLAQYIMFLLALFALAPSLNSQGFAIKVVPEPEAPPADVKPPPEEEPEKAGDKGPETAAPSEFRQIIRVNVKNESKKDVGIYAKLVPLEGQDRDLIQPWEYQKFLAFVKKSSTVQNIVTEPGAQWKWDKSRVQIHTIAEDGKSEWGETLDCRETDSDVGKGGSKSITFRIFKLPNDDVLSCIVYYDLD